MSKSILVIDTPECCDKCRFCCFGNYGAKRCSAKDQSIFLEDKKKKPDWCPLWDLPIRKMLLGLDGASNAIEIRERGRQEGFNSCIDEILKGANGDE